MYTTTSQPAQAGSNGPSLGAGSWTVDTTTSQPAHVGSNGLNLGAQPWPSANSWVVSTSPLQQRNASQQVAVTAAATFSGGGAASAGIEGLQMPVPRTRQWEQGNWSNIADLTTPVDRFIQETNQLGGRAESYLQDLDMVGWRQIGDTPLDPRSKELAAKALIGLNYIRRTDGRYFNEALRLLVNGNSLLNIQLAARAYIGLGRVSRGDDALNNYQRALGLFSLIHDLHGQIQALEGLANAYHGRRDFDNACKHLRQAAELPSDPTSKVHTYEKLGNWLGETDNISGSLVAHWRGWLLATPPKKIEFERVWRGYNLAFAPRTAEEQEAIVWYRGLQTSSPRTGAGGGAEASPRTRWAAFHASQTAENRATNSADTLLAE